MIIEKIHTEKAPAVIGTYSQAMRMGNLLFLSGQIPINPATAQLISDDIELQIECVFKHIVTLLHAANTTVKHVAKLTVYLTDLTYFPLVNRVMATHFSEPYPARAVIGVNALPKNSRVEIDAVAVLDA